MFIFKPITKNYNSLNLNFQIAKNQQKYKVVQIIKDDCFQTYPAILACKG